MVFDSVAVYSFTGTLTIPKVIVPFQIDRAAMTVGLYPFSCLRSSRMSWPALQMASGCSATTSRPATAASRRR